MQEHDIDLSDERWQRQNWSLEEFVYDTDEYGYDDYEAIEADYLGYDPQETTHDAFERRDEDAELEVALIEASHLAAVRSDARTAVEMARFDALGRVLLYRQLRDAADLAVASGGTWHPAVVGVAARLLIMWVNEVDPSGAAASLASTKIETTDAESVSVSLADLLRAAAKIAHRHMHVETPSKPSIDAGALDMLATVPDRLGCGVSELLDARTMWVADISETNGRRRILTVAGRDAPRAFENLIRKHFQSTSRKPDYSDSTGAYAAGSGDNAEIVVFRAIDPDADEDALYGI
ncbi:hypothetical protein [Candidatus Poriferisodalis sp.]|uniref:hypothetical protein n=1 Tax=Candidatus Poriferisodalis sp. TaxID=3101277 RepID=UPI003B025F71